MDVNNLRAMSALTSVISVGSRLRMKYIGYYRKTSEASGNAGCIPLALFTMSAPDAFLKAYDDIFTE